MSYQYVDPYGNSYVRGWDNDFTEEERRELEIGEFNWNSPDYKGPPRGGSLDVDPSRITQGKFQMPGLGNRIEDFLSNLPKAPGLPGERRTTVDPSWVLRGQPDVQPDPTFTGKDWLNQHRPDTDPAITHGNSWRTDRDKLPALPEGTGSAPPGIWPENSLVPPEQRLVRDHLLRIDPQEDKTLRQRVWERDQMPDRTPDSSGRLYPDKNEPGFIDPRIQGDGRMTMQYIPELDNPNWTPANPMPNRNWSRGGEGIQYRR